MLKKLTTLVLAGLLALPPIAMAADLEDRVAALEEQKESWDLSSRIQWNGDFRFRADYLSADAKSHYQALNVARGMVDFIDAQPAMSAIASSYASVGAMSTAIGGAMAGGLAGWRVASDAMGITDDDQEEALYSMFTNPGVGVLLGAMAAYPATTVSDAMANAQALSGFMKQLSAADRAAIFAGMGYNPDTKTDYNNDTIYTNRFRLDLRAKAMENLEFKARLAMYKVWGMQNNAVDYSYNNGMGGGPFMLSSLAFDGSSARQPQDNVLRVDRAFINWNNIGNMPVWFSIGRRPVTDGPPAHIRMGTGKKMATPVAYMDYPFDGLSLGYAYQNLFGLEDLPGRVRLCYGRGFEAGPKANDNGLNDVDFGGLSWDVFKKGDRFFNFQSFAAFNMFNVPDDVNFVNPIEFATWENDSTKYNPLDPSRDLKLNRVNLGDIYHTSSVYMSKYADLNYFVTLGWSHTNAKGMDELGTSLLGSWWETPQDREGYATLLGVRYDLDDLGLKIGAEYNWGSKYWISFTPGHDDLYASKLATRGNVVELYAVYDIPAGEKISKFSQAFFRLGYQHYEYEYTGSGFWLGAPQDIDTLANDPLAAQFYVPVESMDQVYLTMEAWF